jgi:hypothetical protein
VLRCGLIMEGAAGIINGSQLSIMDLPKASTLNGSPLPFAPNVVQGFEGEGAGAHIEVTFTSRLPKEFPVRFGLIRRTNIEDKSPVPSCCRLQERGKRKWRSWGTGRVQARGDNVFQELVSLDFSNEKVKIRPTQDEDPEEEEARRVLAVDLPH